ncbi:MAG: L-threonylcarbamoyladenylate synthase [Chthoniobacterales bacterium]
MKTRVVSTASPQDRESAVAEAVEHLRRGEVVALPTETVYGLAADALDIDAVLKIFEAKERPMFDPLIVHLPDREWIERLAEPTTDEALSARLIEAFWPGPLTIVLPRRSAVPDVVAAGLATVAVRMSAHPVFSEILRSFGRPVAAPSANRFGRISPTTAEHVYSELKDWIPLILDGGPTTHGLESTIVAVRSGGIEVLRPGPITYEQLSQFAKVTTAPASARPHAPGQMRSHYAPRTALFLTDDLRSFQPPAGKRIGALSWRGTTGAFFAELRVLSHSGDLREAATNLFRCLRELDDAQLDLIVAEQVPESGLGAAIMDRLRRAAGR